ncbi:MAG: aldo/keto reductase [Alphaproteobacteria bacterium]|nr:aldo/keto reductase [Alphaproteobacteria bacterium]MDE2163834.1 aldo/keto reductase [Alphaproteobacteria bacterium]MDE2265029.1 aldo/keto reductase [Alphaproteobacteria bacterium]
MGERAAELVFGTVQLGLDYGAANKTGKPSHGAALKLVRRAADAGIVQFDTARAYGDSEERLGEALDGRAVHTITKLSPLADLPANARRDEVRDAVDASIAESLYALRRRRIDCLLLHRAAHMTAFDGAVWERLLERLDDGSVLTLGVSVQSPAEALAALACRDVKHIQLPFNLLDWRWREAGVVDAIEQRRDVIVHARSVFLQGLLAAEDPAIWPRIDGVDPVAILEFVAQLAKEFRRESTADLCLAYARGQKFIDGVVIGLETEEQLDANLRLSVKQPLDAAECAAIEKRVPRLPESLLNPAQWPKP